jgi:DNA polymerase elongation subunit (family B)
VIGYKLRGKETELLYFKDEKEPLTKFWGKLQEIKPNLIVTFNGYNFDIPFIQIRSQTKGVQPSMDINLNKWRIENSNHFDCMQVLSASQTFLNVALDISCKIFEIPVPKPRYYGDDVYKLYENGDMDAIKEHCRQDVELTEQLYLRLRR